MSETPVGGILGTLRLDAEQFHREIEKALAEAELLTSKDLVVKVKTEGAERTSSSMRAAAGSMDEASAASRRLSDATDRVKVAELKLDEVKNKTNATASQHLTAMQALTRARRAEQDAIFATYKGNLNLASSEDEVAKATRGASGEVRKMGQSFGGLGGDGGMMSPAVIVSAIGAAMALLGPVTGAATAAVGGFAGAAGTAALAWVGFNKEIERGTAVGKYLHSELGGIKKELVDLGTTASTAMTGDVLSSLEEVHQFLPTLDDGVVSLAGHLGRAFHTTTGGLLTSLRVMMPLLQDGGAYAEILANKFADFAASPQFKDFIAYSRRELPNVFEAIMSLTTGITSLGVALAPVGDDLINLIKVSGDAATAIAPLVHTLAQSSTGPASLLGQLSAVSHETSNMSKVVSVANPVLALLTRAMQDSAPPTKLAADAVGAHTSQVQLQTGAQSSLAVALGTTDAALAPLLTAQKSHAQAAADATRQMQLENDAAGLLKSAFDRLTGKALSAADAQNAFDSSLANMGDHVTAQGKKIHFTTTSINNMSAASVALRGQLNGQVHALEGVIEANGGLANATGKAKAQYALMRKQIIDNAVAHRVDREAVTKYLDKLIDVNNFKPKPTKLEIDQAAKAKALADIEAMRRALAQLGNKTVVVTTMGRYVNNGPSSGGGTSTGGGSTRNADGGYITGPGTGTSDSIPAWLSNGEFVINAASTSRHKGLLESINAGKFAKGGPVGYASGGPVSVPVGQYFSDYMSSIGSPVTKAQLVADNNHVADAVTRLNLAEMQLEQDRRKRHHTALQLARDEAAITHAREALTAATARQSNDRSKFASQQGTILGQFGAGLGIGIRNTGAFIANLEKLASRGYGVLAQQLAGMGNADAEKIAAQAAGASTKSLDSISANVARGQAQQGAMSNINGITAILAALKGGNLGARGIAAKSGVDITEILSAIPFLLAQLKGNKNASSLLRDYRLAQGGNVIPFANGGIADIVPAGAMRLMAEPETGGEAYIPLAPAKRGRSTAILAETNRRMGNPLGGHGTVQHFHIAPTDPYVLASELSRRNDLLGV